MFKSKLLNNFDLIIFSSAKRQLRLKRFISNSGNKELFNLLNNKQMADRKKSKFCDHIVVNEKNLDILKNNLLAIIEKYE